MKDEVIMEVLRPSLLKIGNRIYRKYPTSQTESKQAKDELFEDYAEYAKDESCDNVEVVATEKGFEGKMSIASEYFKYIIGKKGETKKRIENETRTQIRIPTRGQDGDIVILGRDKKGVVSAYTRLELLVISARQKQPFTHFLSIPITAKSIHNQVLEFKEDVLRECDGDLGLDASIFQNYQKLHLTIGTLVLLSESEVEKATELLNKCNENLIRPLLKDEPLHCQLVGLEYMNDDPGAVDVLYIKVIQPENSERLEVLCNQLVEKFTVAGLMQKDYDRVKLHATIMNTLFRSDPSGVARVQSNRGAPRKSFDAKQILKKFGNFDFGSYYIGEIHLSKRYSSGKDGYYIPAAVIKLP
ncbi:activating signal cointegrator 1 complex subunit 1 isoform X1 [Octopus sinensis]|uniref:Activating signal cointegrator 1 complex subunit 1 isoform X1 n=1 Tax=Octopus sinensis TaxID=2607531 RepID=A0A6P7TFE5_9MOLL|nr:activating signal cointegrator 1 complex subunit 1 isoform X1 [Octopus sinensis]